MNYIDCYLTPVPCAHRARYEALAQISAEVVREHGALRVVESWLDEAGPEAATYHGATVRLSSECYPSFRAAAGAKPDEAVALSWVEWPDKRSRDEGMAKVTADPRMQFDDQPPVFDGTRLIAGGFLPMLDCSYGA
ncbi:conserved hypothetical protein [Thiomonas sp. X19]|uniref:DUF1428 domain-containing protein n=1 Tax=Thiomonas sp. X19 TaxID=1050370 RepID=UPI000B62F389|nr:DUF1428 domain-containing protein [Thiomonas sp. X19]SCC91756.1 conserved hypothetical protein [Thiomonas sp. X19]